MSKDFPLNPQPTVSMKNRLIIILRTIAVLAALVYSSVLNAQTVTLTVTAPASGTAYSTDGVVLAAGDTATVVSQFSQIPGASAVQIGNAEFSPPPFLTNGSTGIAQAKNVTVAGPAIIRAKIYSGPNGLVDGNNVVGWNAFITVNITRANATPSVAPLNAVVIPEDAAGSFNVVLESSTDLITWTAANPGAYGGTTTKRFFRVRVIKQ
jgi:hypothetical protein